jgi:hypothetical protein
MHLAVTIGSSFLQSMEGYKEHLVSAVSQSLVVSPISRDSNARIATLRAFLSWYSTRI